MSGEEQARCTAGQRRQTGAAVHAGDGGTIRDTEYKHDERMVAVMRFLARIVDCWAVRPGCRPLPPFRRHDTTTTYVSGTTARATKFAPGAPIGAHAPHSPASISARAAAQAPGAYNRIACSLRVRRRKSLIAAFRHGKDDAGTRPREKCPGWRTNVKLCREAASRGTHGASRTAMGSRENRRTIDTSARAGMIKFSWRVNLPIDKGDTHERKSGHRLSRPGCEGLR